MTREACAGASSSEWRGRRHHDAETCRVPSRRVDRLPVYVAGRSTAADRPVHRLLRRDATMCPRRRHGVPTRIGSRANDARFPSVDQEETMMKTPTIVLLALLSVLAAGFAACRAEKAEESAPTAN